MLIALLQRSPVVRMLEIADEMVTTSPIGSILKSSVAAIASLGAINSLAGATTLSTNAASPVNAVVGTAISPVAFSILGTISPPGSWQVVSNLPPGLTLIDPAGSSASLSGAYSVASPGTINTPNPVLTGTPTTAGTYNINLIAWQNSGATGASTNPPYVFTVIVGASANAPAFSTQPQSAVVAVGASLNLTAAASGSPTYQWRKNGNAISGATAATLAVSTAAVDAGSSYDVVATNGSGSTTSAPATVTVYSPTAAPLFTVQPFAQSVNQGVGVTFNATAVGAGTVTYQWQFAGSAIAGQTGATLTLSNAQVGNQGAYSVIATNANGSTPSANAGLTVVVAAGPVITNQPVSLTVAPGGTASFSVTATGATAYQWNFNGSAIAGAKSATYSISNITNANAGTYTVVVDNIVSSDDGYGGTTTTGAKTTSNAANLTVASVAAPAFTTQPQSQSVNAGANVTFTAAASGTPTYQWLYNGSNISGQTNATLTLNGVTTSQAGNYSVIATNSGGSVPSTTAVLSVAAVVVTVAPTITAQPVSLAVAPGGSAVFTAAASGTPTPTYQWYLGSTPVSGATSARLVLTNTSTANAGSYTVVATNSAGTKTSSAATLAVTATSNPGRLINLSVLSVVQGSLTMGYVIGGSGVVGSESLLIRATGPALAAAPFNIPGTMVDPTLTVVKQAGSVTIATNAGWGANASAVTAADSAVGAFALGNTASLDSAVVTQLPVSGGGYTATVASKTNGSGYALTEVYDATPSGTYTVTTPRLVNLSCLTSISAGGTLTVGCVVGGSTAKTVLVRVSGPTLAVAPFGIGGTMTDPQLSVQPLSSATTILASNAGWGGDSQIASVASGVGAFAFASASSKDSAALVTLAAGVPYTVQVNSASGGGGLVLVEIYEVP